MEISRLEISVKNFGSMGGLKPWADRMIAKHRMEWMVRFENRRCMREHDARECLALGMNSYGIWFVLVSGG